MALSLFRRLPRQGYACALSYNRNYSTQTERNDVLKEIWKKEIRDRREVLLALSPEERADYLDVEGMPFSLQTHHRRVQDTLGM